jgi:hypothetical protein
MKLITITNTRELSVPDYGTYIDDEQLMKLVRDSGSHFFDRDTMRSFKSRLHDIYPGQDGWYFVTSEKHEHYGYSMQINEPRKYTVRRLRVPETLDDLRLDEIGEFQQYPTLNRARTAAKYHAKHGVQLCPKCQHFPCKQWANYCQVTV